MSDQPKAEPVVTPEVPKDEPQPTRINWNEVPEAFRFLENIVKDSNAEAARYRKERNEARDALSKAKSPEDFAKLQAENAELRKREIASKHKVPEEMLEFLTADDEAGLEAQAAKLGKKEEPAAPPKDDPVVITTLPPSGGSNPLGDPNPPADGKSEYQRWKEAGGLNR